MNDDLVYRYVAYDKHSGARMFREDKDSAKAYADLRDLMKQFIKKFPPASPIDKWVIRLELPE